MIRKIRGWIKDKAGVSPIIAIILMVAITVVLAATIYVWVSGMGKSGSAAPSLSLVQYTKGNNYVVYLVSGVSESIDIDDLSALVGTSSASITLDSDQNSNGMVDARDYVNITLSSGTIPVGDSITIIHKPSGTVIFNAKVK